jgi:penicillin-binding protein 1A
VVRRGTAYRAVWGSGFRVPSAGKTGTTNDGADVWYIGYTADLVAGVWMGMDRPRKIKGNAQGGELAAPAWTAFMTEVYRRKPAPPDWPRPDGIIPRDIDRASGLLANDMCPDSVATDYFIIGTEPAEECVPTDPFYLGGTSDSTGVTAGAVPAARPVPRDTANPFRLPPR